MATWICSLLRVKGEISRLEVPRQESVQVGMMFGRCGDMEPRIAEHYPEEKLRGVQYPDPEGSGFFYASLACVKSA